MRIIAALFVLLFAMLPSGLGAQTMALAPGLFWLPGHHAPGAQPDGNSVLLRGASGWVIVDSGRHAVHTQALLDFISTGDEHGEQPLFIINSHWHLDHLGGNALLRRARPGLQAYASAALGKALQGWLADYQRQLEGLLASGDLDPVSRASADIDLALLQQAQALRPDHLIEGGPQPLTLAGRRLRVGVLGTAVSGGDVWVLDLETNTLISGDLLTLPVPFLDTACPEGWLRALDALAEERFERVIPGHGPVLARVDFDRYRAAYAGLLRCAASESTAAQCGEAWLSALGPLVAAEEQPRARQMLAYYLEHSLRSEKQRLRFCAPESAGLPERH
ncbi:MBL fold metallo-hydrolase [Paucibacter sp. APW11]|uniref:MBL fold metallo-hydrolase n=1 Tax=Roseateles aquae TaxID=3077235 RepID=A0ABU3P5N7_9BURK|nr:MBL fold metallo-hydrolase [Paucibacter sp. APW11]MDT8997894.1 MBL fold metallo-hydrolase [Paucibacter sp. APW11]